MPLYVDQLERQIELKQTPQRIISLVPSQTELLFDLGLDAEVTGITKFCVHPDTWFRNKTRVGGTKQLHINKIKELQPDLIIANKEENVKHQVEELAKEFPVWISDINNLQDAYEMMQSIGEITAKQKQSETLITQIKTNFSQLQIVNSNIQTCYLIWKDPYMTIGGDTFINDMLNHAGFKNVFADKLRYPEININELSTLNCELLLLSSEPYPFKQKHVEELQKQLPNTKIVLVDGEIFSWYGSRLLKAPAYFSKLQQQIQSLYLF
jgi:ABC-type Fe3+-hydroxamate transport system substrate-binding protein